ncbi:hypothetical protein Acr_08g0001310 [Actinidia rufa]|uniref:FBD domain-containing protein n=1 Tax=Actinidia rufa TaxID=165716 RepID=A0A7J0EZ60_9ERIC|nr:hypothetical protein Acr_08g0001310 [Actinidia rufa]
MENKRKIKSSEAEDRISSLRIGSNPRRNPLSPRNQIRRSNERSLHQMEAPLVVRPQPHLRPPRNVPRNQHAQWRIVSDFFNCWVISVLRGGVKELHIDVPIGGPDHRPLNLPQSFFACETLVDLKLGGEGGYFSRIYGDCRHKVVVDAPFVEHFSVEDNLLACYFIRNQCSLMKACIDVGERFSGTLGDDRANYLFELLRGISDVKSLQLSDHTIRALGYADNYVRCIFPNLIRLELSVSSWSRLIDLLGRMPRLESLRLIKNDESGDLKNKGKVSGAENGDHNENSGLHITLAVPGCLLSHLKLIKVDSFRGREDQLQLVKYFLNNAKVLNKMIIVCEYLTHGELVKFKNKILMFPRGSETCQIEVYGPDASPSHY